MIETSNEVAAGDVIEFTHGGERRTAEVMLITDDGFVLLDLHDGERPVHARVGELDDVAVFRPDELTVAA